MKGGEERISNPDALEEPSQDEINSFVSDVMESIGPAKLDLTSENSLQRSFEIPLMNVVTRKAQFALEKMFQGQNSKAIFEYRPSIKFRNDPPKGDHQTGCSALLLKFLERDYILALLCRKKNSKALRICSPCQEVTYLLKTIHPEYRFEDMAPVRD